MTSSLYEKKLLATRDVHMTVWRNVLRDKCSCKDVLTIVSSIYLLINPLDTMGIFINFMYKVLAPSINNPHINYNGLIYGGSGHIYVPVVFKSASSHNSAV